MKANSFSRTKKIKIFYSTHYKHQEYRTVIDYILILEIPADKLNIKDSQKKGQFKATALQVSVDLQNIIHSLELLKKESNISSLSIYLQYL
jgi:hypothetical protein